jgi:transcriptional regulator with XRE-family HTH domain
VLRSGRALNTRLVRRVEEVVRINFAAGYLDDLLDHTRPRTPLSVCISADRDLAHANPSGELTVIERCFFEVSCELHAKRNTKTELLGQEKNTNLDLDCPAPGAYRFGMSRLRDLRTKRGLSQAALAELAGTSQPQIKRLEDGVRKLTKEWAERLAPHLSTTAQALLFEPKLVASFDPDAPEDAAGDEGLVPPFPPDAIRELSASAGMGSGQTITTSYARDGADVTAVDAVKDDYWRIPHDFVHHTLGASPAGLLIMEGKGDSMSPTVNSGDKAVVDISHKKPSPDGLYAIRDFLDEVVIKRLEVIGGEELRIRIISDNPRHAPQEFALDQIAIVGKVVALIKLV